jgi:predicted dehydrogenase
VAVGQQEALLSELQAFVALANGRGDAAVPDFEQGMASLAVAEAITGQILRGGE